VEGLWIPLPREGDDLVLGEGRDGPEFDDLALGEVFEVQNRESPVGLRERPTLTLEHLMRRIVLCLFALAPLSAAACGGDSGPPLTSEEFVKQANAICKDRDAKIADKAKEIFTNPNPSSEQLGKFFVEEAIPNARGKLKDLGELRPPTKEKDKFKKMLKAGDKALDAAEKGFKEQGNSTTTFRQGEGSDLYKETNKQFNDLAKDLKLSDCAEPA
jgi:hypothetical protein